MRARRRSIAFYAANHVLVKGALFLDRRRLRGARASARPSGRSPGRRARAQSRRACPSPAARSPRPRQAAVRLWRRREPRGGLLGGKRAADAAFCVAPAAFVAVRRDGEPGAARPLLAGGRARRALPALPSLSLRRRLRGRAFARRSSGTASGPSSSAASWRSGLRASRTGFRAFRPATRSSRRGGVRRDRSRRARCSTGSTQPSAAGRRRGSRCSRSRSRSPMRPPTPAEPRARRRSRPAPA